MKVLDEMAGGLWAVGTWLVVTCHDRWFWDWYWGHAIQALDDDQLTALYDAAYRISFESEWLTRRQDE